MLHSAKWAFRHVGDRVSVRAPTTETNQGGPAHARTFIARSSARRSRHPRRGASRVRGRDQRHGQPPGGEGLGAAHANASVRSPVWRTATVPDSPALAERRRRTGATSSRQSGPRVPPPLTSKRPASSPATPATATAASWSTRPPAAKARPTARHDAGGRWGRDGPTLTHNGSTPAVRMGGGAAVLLPGLLGNERGQVDVPRRTSATVWLAWCRSGR